MCAAAALCAVGALALLPASASAFFDMTVSTSATTPGDFSGGVFTPTVSGANLNVGDLTAALAGGPVTITTGTGSDGGTDSGTITASSELPASTVNQLTLDSNGGVNLTAGVAATLGATAAAPLIVASGPTLAFTGPLDLTLSAGYTRTSGPFTLISSSSPFAGQFSGLAEGATFSPSAPNNNARFTISYMAGGGLDVTLTSDGAIAGVAVTSSSPTSTQGSPVTFTATIRPTAPATATPTGTVTFMNGATALGSPVAVGPSGVATLATSALPVGSDPITASYGGDHVFNPASGATTQTVHAPPPAPPKPPAPRVVHVALGLPLSYVCVVPNLLGFTQAQAVKLLARGHCALGSVRRPRHHLIRNRKVIVYFQQYAAGSWYSIGRRVSVDIH